MPNEFVDSFLHFAIFQIKHTNRLHLNTCVHSIDCLMFTPTHVSFRFPEKFWSFLWLISLMIMMTKTLNGWFCVFGEIELEFSNAPSINELMRTNTLVVAVARPWFSYFLRTTAKRQRSRSHNMQRFTQLSHFIKLRLWCETNSFNPICDLRTTTCEWANKQQKKCFETKSNI